MNTNVMFSSKTDLWETPQNLFDKYDAIYHFETDVCALPENAKCKRFFPPRMDGLKQEWTAFVGAILHTADILASGLKRRSSPLQLWLCYYPHGQTQNGVCLMAKLNFCADG